MNDIAEEICSVSEVDHYEATKILRDFTGKEGGLWAADWYGLRDKIASIIAMTKLEVRQAERAFSARMDAEAADTITRLQAELSSAKEAHLSILKEERAYARAEALEDTLREVVLCPVGTQEGWQGKLDMRNEIAAAIRRLKEGR